MQCKSTRQKIGFERCKYCGVNTLQEAKSAELVGTTYYSQFPAFPPDFLNKLDLKNEFGWKKARE